MERPQGPPQLKRSTHARRRWVAVLLLLVGAGGCAKGGFPTIANRGAASGGRFAAVASALGIGGGSAGPTRRLSADGDPSPVIKFVAAQPANPEEAVKAARIRKLCDKLAEQNGQIPHRYLDEYQPLRDMLNSMSTIVQGDPDVFKRAHKAALHETNSTVLELLDQENHKRERDDFKAGLHEYIHYDRLREKAEDDIQTVISHVMWADEGSGCSDYYLDFFYRRFVAEVDPFSAISFGSNSTPSQPTTLKLELQGVPDEITTAPAQQDRTASNGGRALWIQLFHWDSGPTLDQITTALEGWAKQKIRHGIVIDLRYSWGDSPGALARIRQSAIKGEWGALPMLIITNRLTRGDGAVWATELAFKQNVQVWGTSSTLYGYGRTLKQQAKALISGVTEVSLTVGASLLNPPGEAPGTQDGYRLRLQDPSLLDKIIPDDMIARADAFTQNMINDAPGQPDQPDPNAGDQPPAALPDQQPPPVAQPALAGSGLPDDPNAQQNQQAQMLPPTDGSQPGNPATGDPTAPNGGAPQPPIQPPGSAAGVTPNINVSVGPAPQTF